MQNKEYTTHLCTFMGREANLEILLPYIEGALLNNAVDNYWFIDMTRKRSDHELIKKESDRLNKKFPGRVHLYNSEERSKIIDDPEKISEVSNDWSVFYKFLLKFNDKDVIAKCDDDTYFIDIETLGAAFELRWNNKKPFLMHANAINNGVCAYHQNKAGIWKDKVTKQYPAGGLSGPLFINPDVACKHHKKFSTDLFKNIKNLEKYKLGKNIQFCNRVSINFIFMLGKDRKTLSTITRQDEYDTSSKLPQAEDRPNLLIGDFIMAHHTYGNQEPTMERLKTDAGYKKLCEKIDPANTTIEPKNICKEVNPTTTIKQGDSYIAKSWVNQESYIMKVPNEELYVSLDEGQEIINKSGKSIKKRITTNSDKVNAVIVDFDINKKSPILITNSASLFKTPDAKDAKRTYVAPQSSMTSGGAIFHSDVVFKKMNSGNYKIILAGNKKFKLYLNDHKNLGKRLYFAENEDYEWELISLKDHADTCLAMNISRPKNPNEYINDMTVAKSENGSIPNYNIPREFIWMVKDYIWEFVPSKKENHYFIKLIADDKPDLYLSYNKKQDKVLTTNSKDEWIIEKQFLKHQASGKYLNIKNGEVKLLPKKSKLVMCPQK